MKKIITIILIAGVLGCLHAPGLSWTAEQAKVADDSLLDELQINRDFTKAADFIIPSVVSIHCIKVSDDEGDYWEGDFEYGELNEILREPHRSIMPYTFKERGTGSGMIVSRVGHILTNVHVVETSESIVVTLHDKRTYEAEILGIDPLTEIALIKIDADHLQPVTMGNSDHCRVGEWVLAIGNPLELSATITAGIISAKGREINIISDMYGVENFIQTDAAINPGNSGGPLINLKGEVIGITTAIATENGYSQGYGFAIPINLAREIMNDLVRFGKVTRGYLGISMQDIDEKRARALGLKKPFGVFVDTVSEDGPAYAAGLRERDVLIKIDETSVNQSNSVQSIIVQKDPGKEIVLTVLRKNKLLKLKTTLGVRQSYTNLKKATKTKVQYLYLGLQVESTKRDLSAELGIRSAHGLIVSAVQQYSPAFEAGIQVNDMILEIGEEVIHSIEQFQTIMSSLRPGDVLIMKINRENTIFHAFVEVPLQ